MLEDLPGGLASLRAAVDRFHERGVRVLLSYNPWDQGTRWGCGGHGSCQRNSAKVFTIANILIQILFGEITV